MKSEDKIIRALNVLNGMCDREESLVNKFIVKDMAGVLSQSFKCMQTTIDSMDNHNCELQEEIRVLKLKVDGRDENGDLIPATPFVNS